MGSSARGQPRASPGRCGWPGRARWPPRRGCRRPAGSDPVTFRVAGSGAWRVLAGAVSPAVAYLTMRLAGGTTYRLWPVAWHGHRYVGLVVPWNLQVARFTAYARHGELAFAIPFPVAGGFPRVASWLRAGTPLPPVSSTPVANGQDN